MIKAIVFDFDGTIIDTETAWYTAFREAYGRHGVELTLEQYSLCIGTSLHAFNPYEYLITHHKLPLDREQFRRDVRARHAELMSVERVRPGILAYLQAARRSGLMIGLASSSTRSWVDTYLRQLDLASYFSCISTADDVKRVKPYPELYVRTLDCLGVSPEEAIAIEDSPNGAKAACAAGMYCVVVPNAITKLLPFDEFHHMADCLTDLEWELLLANPVGA
ncbi:MAG: HAD family hydrolase [Paenibacillaceae bacterium]|nr:HAD family hydrolase [Paenibacillaceae bacterium]